MKTPVRSLLEQKGSTVESIGPEATVMDAVRLMNDRRLGCLLIMENERPVGIFTERDVLNRVVAAGKDGETTPVREVMTRRLVTISPETTVEKAMVVVTEKRCRHLPVMDGDDLAGMISIGDLTRWIIRNQQDQIEDLVRYIQS